MPRPARNRESGYALLFVFLTVAIIGITLYAAMPRVAFESQRDQEELLIDRGEQYKRALQLYFRKNHTYPAKIEDLESSNGLRFLRQRYKDPMTGKDEWRLIHVGPGGVFTDSLTQKNNNQKQAAPNAPQTFITELKPMTDESDSNTVPTSIGMRRRPSDQPGAPGAGGPGGVASGGPDAGASGADQENVNGLAPAPGAFQSGSVDANGGMSGQNTNTVASGQPGSGSQSGADMIRNILTSPRPGGPPPGVFGGGQINDVGFINGATNANLGSNTNANSSAFNNNNSMFGNTNTLPQTSNIQSVGGTGAAAGMGSGTGSTGTGLGTAAGTSGGLTIGGGIAGFASKSKVTGIKIYKDHQKYNEWEFIYDFGKDTSMTGGQQQIPQNTGLQNGTNGTSNGTTSSTTNNANGTTNSTGASSTGGLTTTSAPILPPGSPGPTGNQ